MPTSGVLKYMSIKSLVSPHILGPTVRFLRARPIKRTVPMGVLALLAVFAVNAEADFVGYYALTNWTLTNTNNGNAPSYTNGTASTPDDGQTVVITGGNSGSGEYGATDLFITAAASGIVQFDWSYYSSDPSSSGEYPYGCGLGFTGSCDDAGYLLNGNYVALANDIDQGSGVVSFSVTAGETFGFEVETMDNLGGPGIFTISDFSAPVPEPRINVALIGLAAILLAVYKKINEESAA